MPLRMSLPRPGEPSCPGMTNHTETLFPKRAIETSPDAEPIIGPRPPPRGGTLPADQANPISVVLTLQRISRSRKRVIAMRPKDVEAVTSHRGKPPSPMRLPDDRAGGGPRSASPSRCLVAQSSKLARKDTVLGSPYRIAPSP